MWNDLILSHDKTYDFKSLAFRMWSMLEAVIQRGLTEKHQQGPVKAFTVLAGQPFSQGFIEDPKCTRCDWANYMLTGFGDDYYQDRLLLAMYRLCAMLTHICITTIENLHATLRRILVILQCQTSALDFTELSSKFACVRCRRGVGVSGQPLA